MPSTRHKIPWDSQPQEPTPLRQTAKPLSRLMLGSLTNARAHPDLATGQMEAWSVAPVKSVTRHGIGVGTTAYASPALSGWAQPLLVPANGAYTAFIILNLSNKSPLETTNVLPVNSPNTFLGIKIGAGALNYYNNKTVVAPIVQPSVGLQVIAVTVGTAQQRFYRNGQLDAVGASADIWYPPTGVNMYRGNSLATENQILAMGTMPIGLSDAELAEFTADPWNYLFEPEQRDLYLVVGGGGSTANLAGNAAAQATASGALSKSVPIAAAGIAVATATGAVSISIPLAASAIAQASASGTLATSGSLAGTATATSTASGSISLAIPLSASAVAQALASAGLVHTVTQSGVSAAQASAAGNISLDVSLAGDALAQVLAAAGLTVTNASSLSGAAAVYSTASASISNGVPVSGAALSVAAATGNITHIVPVGAAAAAASSATGGLDIGVHMDGSALVEALAAAGLDVTGASSLSGTAAADSAAAATLTLRVNLDGAALASAQAAGILAGNGLIKPHPDYIAVAVLRSYQAIAPARSYRVSA